MHEVEKCISWYSCISVLAVYDNDNENGGMKKRGSCYFTIESCSFVVLRFSVLFASINISVSIRVKPQYNRQKVAFASYLSPHGLHRHIVIVTASPRYP